VGRHGALKVLKDGDLGLAQAVADQVRQQTEGEFRLAVVARADASGLFLSRYQARFVPRVWLLARQGKRSGQQVWATGLKSIESDATYANWMTGLNGQICRTP
jgi:hypothetical protein